MTTTEAAGLRLFLETTHQLLDIELEKDLPKKVERLERLAATLEFVVRVMPELGDTFYAEHMKSINHRIELAENYVARLYEDGEEWKLG